MAKGNDIGGLRALSNKMKSKGLQKLRWYCQMCQKQCRDENGFKCHTTSEGHLRMMKVFAENPHKILDEFSRDFERGYLDVLHHRHGTKRVLANRVYQEYIADKQHIHMNGTIWSSLAGFVKYLGKEGKAVVEETEKGWYIQYIDKDPRMIAKQAASAERKQADLDDDERTNRMIAMQLAAASDKRRRYDDESDCQDDVDDSSRVLDEDRSKINISIAIGGEKKKQKIISAFEDDETDNHKISFNNKNTIPFVIPPLPSPPPSSSSSSSSSSSLLTNLKRNALEQVILDDKEQVEAQLKIDDKRDRKDYWLHPNIVVKIMNKKLSDGKYYKEKGTVRKVLDKYIGEVKLENGTILRLDQNDLETVIPQVGRHVLVVNGRCRGMKATLLAINEDKFNCSIRIEEGTYNKRVVDNVDYEDISKVDE